MTPRGTVAVEARGISKTFDGVVALDEVDLELRRGEVHALLGENGAGKTTLSNVLAGIYRADSGTILVDGREVHIRTPAQAIDAGIGMVHQNFRLVAPMTVAENVHLGWEETPPFVTGASLVERTRQLMDQFGLHADPSAKVWQLSVGEQQRVEIVRVLSRGADVLILDEPTAVLTAEEAQELFAVIRRLVAGGRTVVFISHKLNEVLEISDRVTVLRGGRNVVTRPTAGATGAELARLMTGVSEELDVEHRDTGSRPPVLGLRGVTARGSRGEVTLHSVDLTVREGEILGIAGVSGNGQSELAEVICGLRRVESGAIIFDGTELTNASPRAIAEAGVGHIPEDRLGVGLVRTAPVKDNAILRQYRSPELSTPLMMKRGPILRFAENLVNRARVYTRSLNAAAGLMSGGNQQRLVAHREAMIAERLLVAAHPTRGLDVLATVQVREALIARRDAGCAVLLISDDLDEVMMMSDRVAVMYEGHVLGVFERRHADREHIGLLMGGHVVEAADR
jgi:simple sugar transport system ATP-binding protein